VESFTPPAHVYTMSDRLTLRRIDLDGRHTETLLTFPPTPIVGRLIDQYRGRLFGHVVTAIGFSPSGDAQVALRMDVPAQPATEQWHAGRVWDEQRGAWTDRSWTRDAPPLSVREGTVLSGDWEAMTLRGRQALPAAIVLHDHVTRKVRALVRSAEFDALYPDGPPLATIEAQSRRADIERLETITRTHEQLVARFRAEGMPEAAAFLAAAKEMQRLGFYPKTPTLTARLLDEQTPPPAEPEVPTFEIGDMEFTVGLFPDIAAAIASPGTPVDKDTGDYLIHDHYPTSRHINAWLRTGANTFLVRAHGRLYELTIERP
jgi:hypothetical protein